MQLRFALIGLLILTACVGRSSVRSENAITIPVDPSDHSVRMMLRVMEDFGDERVVGIVVQNPLELPIQSVRSWLRFDPESVQFSGLQVTDGRFSLSAPGERNIDTSQGLVRLGLAATIHVRDSLFTLATLRMKTLEGREPVITFYDWRGDGEGHSAVLTFSGGTLLNILSVPPSINL